MKVLFFYYTHDNIQKLVKQETSYLAERRSDTPLKQGDNFGSQSGELFNDLLVMDEEYDVLFRRLFDEAHAEIILRIPSKYLAPTPTDLTPTLHEFPDFSKDRDFSLWLTMHCDFPMQYKKSIDIKLQQFIVDYICYRWLENKSPRDASGYFGRLEKTMDDINRLMMRKVKPLKRLPSFP